MTREIKTALVTGSGQRIGRSIALALVAEGWDVAVQYYSSGEEADQLCQEISARGQRAAAIRGNLSSLNDVASLISQARKALGPISCLINNASLFEPDEMGNISETSWDNHLNTNLRAPVFLSQEFANQLPDNVAGNIINIIDQRVIKLKPDYMSYTISKAALWAFTQTAAISLAPKIRVNAISPGPTIANYRQSEAQFKEQCKSMPLGYGSSPDEIANAARFILATPSMTGEMITIDGGQHLPSYPPNLEPDPYE